MKLTPLQLKIQKRSDKTLSFGCEIRSKTYNPTNIIYMKIIGVVKGSSEKIEGYDIAIKLYEDVSITQHKGVFYKTSEFIIEEMLEEYDIIGHPITYGYLGYLMGSNMELLMRTDNLDKVLAIDRFAKENLVIRKQTVLERPVEFQELVLDFLETLEKISCNS